MRVSVAGAAAEFGLDDRVAARGQELRQRPPAPDDAAHHGPAVHQHHGWRRRAAGCTRRQRQPHRHGAAVAHLDALEVLQRHACGVDGWQKAPQAQQLLACTQPDVVTARVQVSPAFNHHHSVFAVAAAAAEAVHAAGQALVDLLLQGLQRGVDPDGDLAIGECAHTQCAAAAAFADQAAAEVEARHLHCGRGRGALLVKVVARQHAGAVWPGRVQHVQLVGRIHRHGAPGHLQAVGVQDLLPVLGARHAPVHAHAAIGLRDGHARLAVGVKEPLVDVRWPAALDAAYLQRLHVQAQRQHGDQVAGTALQLADDDFTAAVLRHEQDLVVGVQAAVWPADGAFRDERVFQLHQLPRRAARASDAVQARCKVQIGRSRAVVGDAVDEEVVADPAHVEDVAVGIAGQRLGLLQVLQVQHHQHVVAGLALAQVAQVAARRRQQRVAHIGQAEEGLHRHLGGTCCRAGRVGVLRPGGGAGQQGQAQHACMQEGSHAGQCRGRQRPSGVWFSGVAWGLATRCRMRRHCRSPAMPAPARACLAGWPLCTARAASAWRTPST